MADFPAQEIVTSTVEHNALQEAPADDIDEIFANNFSDLVFTMRGFDTVLGRNVTWPALEIDADASEYANPADINVATIVVFKIKGKP